MHTGITSADTIHHQLVSVTDASAYVFLCGALRQQIDMAAPPAERASFLQMLFGNACRANGGRQSTASDIPHSAVGR